VALERREHDQPTELLARGVEPIFSYGVDLVISHDVELFEPLQLDSSRRGHERHASLTTGAQYVDLERALLPRAPA